MEKIEKIIIKGCSGYGSVDEAYDDKVVITSSSIGYEYLPIIESELNQKRKWTYKTNSPLFKIAFDKVCDMMPKILFADNIAECTDVGMFDFTVAYEDKTKKHVCYWCTGQEFEDLFKLIKQLIPNTEYVPAVLLTSDDYSYEDEE